VGSIIILSLFNFPIFSASSIIERAILSFTLPPGLKDSSFANTSAKQPSVILFNFTRGVFPISSITLFATLISILPFYTF